MLAGGSQARHVTSQKPPLHTPEVVSLCRTALRDPARSSRRLVKPTMNHVQVKSPERKSTCVL